MVVEIRDWCQNVGEYNTYNFCIWHFGLCLIVSKIDRCRSSDPPYEIAINPWWRGGRGLPSLIALLFMWLGGNIIYVKISVLVIMSKTRHKSLNGGQRYSDIYLAPHRGRARYCNAHVCLSVCLFVRVFAKFQSVISQPFLNRSL